MFRDNFIDIDEVLQGVVLDDLLDSVETTLHPVHLFLEVYISTMETLVIIFEGLYLLLLSLEDLPNLVVLIEEVVILFLESVDVRAEGGLQLFQLDFPLLLAIFGPHIFGDAVLDRNNRLFEVPIVLDE